MEAIQVIGGGLAGSEAAWQIARRGIPVQLYEMRPEVKTAAHAGANLAELVCSNSFGSKLTTTAGGLLKKELELLGSLIVETALETSVPAGSALAVDRHLFSELVTKRLQEEPLIEIIRDECRFLPEGPAIIATGPLTSPGMVQALEPLAKEGNLYFYDAVAPIVSGESIDYEQGFWAARYGRGSADYFNCPLSAPEYELFWQELVQAELAPLEQEEEDLAVFEACLPLEVIAKRGKDALRYGPFRPVGLEDSQGRRPYAVLQLRKENAAGTMLGLVGCQTRLKWGEQRRIFGLIPALRHGEFLRYGVMHRNTFLNSPRILAPTFQFLKRPQLFLAGQISGVEGYMESTASGLLAGINAVKLCRGQTPAQLPRQTMLGSLANYVAQGPSSGNFQPMNANFGLLPPLETRIRNKHERKEAYSQRALTVLREYLAREEMGLT